MSTDRSAASVTLDTIIVNHDLNDREADGSYSVWLRPGTLVLMTDGDAKVFGSLDEHGLFVRVREVKS